jgi:hypothetical protein
MNADQEERTKHVLRRAYEIGIISADEFVRLHEFEESEEDPRDAEIERLTTENEQLRRNVRTWMDSWASIESAWHDNDIGPLMRDAYAAALGGDPDE